MKSTCGFLLFSFLLAGCHRSGSPVETRVQAAETIHFDPEAVRIMQPVPAQRFTPTTSVLVSYDTETGQICKTYKWQGTGDEGMSPCEALVTLRAVAK